MKSLEIVDKKIKEIKDDEFWIELSKRELQQIKQDLEVLEILRLIFKKSTYYVIKGDLETFYSITINDEVGDCVDFDFREPEYDKIVKWLEREQ